MNDNYIKSNYKAVKRTSEINIYLQHEHGSLFVREQKEPLTEKQSQVVLGLDEPDEHDDQYVQHQHELTEVCFLARNRCKVAVDEHVLDEHPLALGRHDVAWCAR